MSKPILAAILNFFLPGVGYLLTDKSKALAVGWLIGVIGLTYVETSLQTVNPTLWGIMFASVFISNTAFAVDAYRAARVAGSN